MGKSQRDKGNRTERAIVNAIIGMGIAAKRVPLSGMTNFHKGDVVVEVQGQPWTLEVKARENGFKQIYSWLEGMDALVIKADRKQALVVMPLNTFCELIKKSGEPPTKF